MGFGTKTSGPLKCAATENIRKPSCFVASPPKERSCKRFGQSGRLKRPSATSLPRVQSIPILLSTSASRASLPDMSLRGFASACGWCPAAPSQQLLDDANVGAAFQYKGQQSETKLHPTVHIMVWGGVIPHPGAEGGARR